ncbi:probable Xaa-Pro dipeptidase protein [Stappia aggregata IAM 12614]|jgi:Xaa-Pro dipeptidase|uniref:Probable Xaa-Pro dipeptidase protein n=1 Tax=Roseibium aggregatum (strain ATCC 25650 / DSM 13394 / JCM 20685 / NBRC 16684 / NCIMB 2208 / IAM 12614 / B1) TaxID=384765 RepID=A0NYK2_ROSAI|nr:Xaa-Pro peptidase family protein [Roseibium aggregatum]EAV42198.1 probable Xaa-Pro dipeptidase protein [Stappia aggregata IAM 12614] [Roseibium aggregatum IAM 12614]
MALHFSDAEFESRFDKLKAAMEAQKLDAMLLFAQESMYWLTGYDTFGFCFFQCLVVTKDGRKVLLTRSADERQAKHTSNIEDIRIWIDRGSASPVLQLKEMLFDMDLLGSRLGVEYDTQGMTGKIALKLNEELTSFADVSDASPLIPELRAVKSAEEIVYVRKASELADKAFYAAMDEIRPGADEGRILAAMQGAIFEGGGDYPGNEFIIGSDRDALLCRYKAGRRNLSDQDQLTLEWAGAYRHYHAALMRTVVIGTPTDRHMEMYTAAREALAAVETQLVPGRTFGDVFDAHAERVDAHGLMPHRLNACGYSLGARFTPSWMDMPMAYRANPAEVKPDMVIFMHMILMDSISGTAMTLGQTYLTTTGAPECLSKLPLDLPVKSG